MPRYEVADADALDSQTGVCVSGALRALDVLREILAARDFCHLPQEANMWEGVMKRLGDKRVHLAFAVLSAMERRAVWRYRRHGEPFLQLSEQERQEFTDCEKTQPLALGEICNDLLSGALFCLQHGLQAMVIEDDIMARLGRAHARLRAQWHRLQCMGRLFPKRRVDALRRRHATKHGMLPQHTEGEALLSASMSESLQKNMDPFWYAQGSHSVLRRGKEELRASRLRGPEGKGLISQKCQQYQ